MNFCSNTQASGFAMQSELSQSSNGQRLLFDSLSLCQRGIEEPESRGKVRKEHATFFALASEEGNFEESHKGRSRKGVVFSKTPSELDHLSNFRARQQHQQHGRDTTFGLRFEAAIAGPPSF